MAMSNVILRTPRAAIVSIGALVAGLAIAGAVTPMTPRLDAQTRHSLVKSLADAGIAEVGSSAVLNSLALVLGPDSAPRQYRYREPYPQLPHVDAEAIPVGAGCSKALLTIWYAAAPDRRVTLSGIYCLTATSDFWWHARSQKVTAP